MEKQEILYRNSKGFIKDDLFFEPYWPEEREDEWICRIETHKGLITVRYKGYGLFTDKERPYEARWENGDVDGYLTSDDIYDHIRKSNSPILKKARLKVY